MESEDAMTDSSSGSAGPDPRALLAQTERDARYTVAQSDAPRGFFPTLAAVLASVVTLMPVIGLPAGFLLLLVIAPVGLWFWLATRPRPTPRTLLRTSGGYTGLFLLGILFLQVLNFWDVETWWQIGMKWAVTFLGLLWLFPRMQRIYRRDRVRDAREDSV